MSLQIMGLRTLQWFYQKRETREWKRDASTLLLFFTDHSKCQEIILVIRFVSEIGESQFNPNQTVSECTGGPGLMHTIGELIRNWETDRLEV